MSSHLSRRGIIAGSASIALALAVTVAGSGNALPRAANCIADPTAPSQCPTLVQRSPDIPTTQRALVTDEARHRLYAIGTDEAGFQSFQAIDTRTRKVITRADYNATGFSEEFAAGVNTVDARLTPDGRTIVASGYVYRRGTFYPAAIAIDTTAGHRRWTWVGSRVGYASSVSLDSQAKGAYIAGYEIRAGADDAMVRAFDITSGKTRWLSYLGRGSRTDTFFEAVSFVAGRVVAVGTDWPDQGDTDQMVATLDPGTGHWVKVRNLDDGGDEFGIAATPGPDHRSLVITGAHTVPPSGDVPDVYANDTETVMVDARTLAVRWRQRQDDANGLGTYVTTIGNRVLVGYAGGVEAETPDVGLAYLQEAYSGTAGRSGLQALDARTGAELWHRDDIAPATMTSFDLTAIAVRQQTAYVIGTGYTADTQVTGNLPMPGYAHQESVRDGFVGALDVVTGKTRWSSDYNDDSNGMDASTFIAGAATDDGLFVAGIMDTRTINPLGGTLNGTLLHYAP